MILKIDETAALRECVRLAAFSQTANASSSQVVTKETRAFAFHLNESMDLVRTMDDLSWEILKKAALRWCPCELT